MPNDSKVLIWKDLQQLSCLDSYWYWSVLSIFTIDSDDLPTLSYKQLCGDMELTLMNE